MRFTKVDANCAKGDHAWCSLSMLCACPCHTGDQIEEEDEVATYVLDDETIECDLCGDPVEPEWTGIEHEHYASWAGHLRGKFVEDGRGVALRIRHHSLELGEVIAVMVGDDREHRIAVSDLTPIPRSAFCGECGQIGCGHDGLDHDVISDGRARRIASEYHDGQFSRLYALASTGAIVAGVEQDIREDSLNSAYPDPDDELPELLAYVRHYGERGPQPGWSEVWEDA